MSLLDSINYCYKMGKITTSKSGQSGVVFSNTGKTGQNSFKPKTLKRKSTYFADPFIVPRVETYLEERSNELEIDADDLIEHLRTKYKEYGKKKFGPFSANVRKALNFIMEKHEIDAEALQHKASRPNKSTVMDDEEDEEAEDFDVDEVGEEGGEEEEEEDEDVLEEEGEDGESDESDLDGESNQNGGRRSSNNRNRMMTQRIGNVVINTGNLPIMIKKFNEAKNSSQELINISSDEDDKETTPQKTTQSSFQNGNLNLGNGYFVKNSMSGPTTLTVVTKKGNEAKSEADKNQTPSAVARTYIKQKFGSVYNKRDVTLKDVGGYTKVLKDVVELVVHLKHPKIYHFLGVNPPRGFLLHGPSGTGKTLLVRALSGELGIPMIKVAAPELVSGLSGGSEERIREVFQQGRTLAPCIIFLDEVDAITPRRDTTQKEMERRIVAQLITSLDELSDTPQGKEILVIGATNRPDAIDPALRRAGRFDREICLGIPDRAARRDILGLLSRNLSLAADVSLDRLAMATPGYVGADLKSLLTEAGIAAVTRIVDVKMKELIELERAKEADAVKDVPMVEIKLAETGEAEETSQSGEPAAKKLKTQDGSELPATGDGAVAECDVTPAKATPDVAVEEVAAAEKAATSSSEAADSAKTVEKKVGQEEPNILNCKWQLSRQELMSLSIENGDFDVAMKKVQPAAKREGFATVPDVTWDDVGSLQDIRQELKLTIMAPVQFPNAFASLGLSAASGVLLCGPPGCGKTLLAKAIANEAGINFISVKGPELLNMYVGESERAVRQCFVRARTSQPCVIFFDEIDALCPKRSDFGDGGASARVVNQLLTEMDGVEDRSGVFLMAASNRPDILDPAVLRPGRIDKILYVGLPTAADRLDILRALTKNGTRPALAADVNLEAVAASESCTGFTGADLSSLVREAGVEALKEFIQACPTPSTNAPSPPLTVAARHFAAALAKVKPSVSEMDQKRYAELKLKYSATPTEQNMEISE